MQRSRLKILGEKLSLRRTRPYLFKSHALIFTRILPGDRDRRKVARSLCIILCNKCPAICFNGLALQKNACLFFTSFIDVIIMKICKFKIILT